jgi:hypothetical protein
LTFRLDGLLLFLLLFITMHFIILHQVSKNNWKGGKLLVIIK